ncbi:uncharacterized protein PV07_00322 [Cladophialophora immunda]|uniref:Uncharacterized protein n=1 Tax=Cladophialophora immunda TaxID=569365 RepID=A0A0D1ZZC0_9EURO|nr:uncharacterized protein PV07_00322 [Cladophialophora immunda]KIW33476.1 hypothetical protein PV07_00322 [Cladophialophora immunda]
MSINPLPHLRSPVAQHGPPFLHLALTATHSFRHPGIGKLRRNAAVVFDVEARSMCLDSTLTRKRPVGIQIQVAPIFAAPGNQIPNHPRRTENKQGKTQVR